MVTVGILICCMMVAVAIFFSCNLSFGLFLFRAILLVLRCYAIRKRRFFFLLRGFTYAISKAFVLFSSSTPCSCREAMDEAGKPTLFGGYEVKNGTFGDRVWACILFGALDCRLGH